MNGKKLSRKPKYLLFITIIFLTLAIRYPLISLEFGVDSFFIRAMAQSLNDNGRGFWLMDIASYFGVYPFSYPSGAPFLLSSFSQSSGLTIRQAIFVLSTVLGILSFFSAYMLASIFFKNDVIRLLTGFFYATAPVMIKFTTMTFPSRGLLLALLPVILWLFLKPFQNEILFRANKVKNIKFLILFLFMLILSFTIHYTAWLILAVAMIFILINLGLKFGNNRRFTFKRTYEIGMLIRALVFTIFLLTVINLAAVFGNSKGLDGPLDDFLGSPATLFLWLIFGILFMLLFNWTVKFKLDRRLDIKSSWPFNLIIFMLFLSVVGSFLHPFSSSGYYSEMNWLGLEGIGSESGRGEVIDPGYSVSTLIMVLVGRYGIIIVPAVFGLFIILTNRDFSVSSWKPWFLICSTLLVLPFISLAPYPLEFFTIFISLFSAFLSMKVISIMKKAERGKLCRIITVCLITAILLSSSYSIYYRLDNEYEFTGDRNYIDTGLLETAIYLKINTKNSSFSDPDSIQTTRLSALTGVESRYKREHDFQYMIWHEIEFNDKDINEFDYSMDSFLSFKESFYRPYDTSYNFTIPPREYYIGPEKDPTWINKTEYVDMEIRFYRIYSNDRTTFWLVNENFGRAVIYTD